MIEIKTRLEKHNFKLNVLKKVLKKSFKCFQVAKQEA